MKPRKLTVLTIATSLLTIQAQEPQPPGSGSALTNEAERLSYAIGMRIAEYCKRLEFEPDVQIIARAIRDYLDTNKPPMLSEQEMRNVMMAAERRAGERAEQRRKQQAAENKQKAEAFLAENKTKPGVITTPSGLQYKVLKDGQGPVPGSNDIVQVHYTGRLLDGTEFDSSLKRGQPLTTPVNRGLIKGWIEALQMMKVGSKWELYVPPELGYGEIGRPGIPPNALLIFEMELITNSPPPQASAPTTPPVTSDIIKVPSLEELQKGAKIEIIKAEDVEKEIQKQQAQQKAAEQKK
ncbi:MAG: FKBP-type peptidyl-prolyl cis-trans isomerase [Verrucomicrobiae bacterium]|nr:FKBP-type peptidyl-prolyl cis-trans isomerase [Verrucomicrobiae bacterium]MCX7721544.1 FKBP-type peptidyl-prolyl cis-trans isomerase [Verrucomicrobiae bacterium]MDW7980334.1 FKBP-type peptidyl-prolyl cis-trans isomerase [Verrucomicrobiales bacterium]